MNHFFKNLKVIELANVLAGPSVGQFFAELGAEVIKIENSKTNGDVTRSWKLGKEDVDSPVSAYFSSVNWGKTSISLDISQSEDKEILFELVQTADVIIASYKPKDAEKLGVDYKSLSRLNSQLIYGKITGYGEDDMRVGYDAIIQAEAGFMYMNGSPEALPTKMPVALVDVLAAHQLKQAILLAIMNRMQTGQGSEVAVSLFDSAVSALVNQATNWLNASHIPERKGSEHPNIAPYGTVFQTKDDNQIILAVGTDRQFAKLCKVLEIKPEAEFTHNHGRVKNRSWLNELLAGAIKQRKSEELLAVLHQEKVPAGKINKMPEVFAQSGVDKIMLHSGEIQGVRQFVAESDLFQRNEIKAPPSFSARL